MNAPATLFIRAARPDDAPRLKERGVQGWETTYADFISAANRAAYLAGDFWSLERLRAIIADLACAAFVAEQRGAIMGFATFEPPGVVRTELTRFYVAPDARRSGAGRALFDDGLAWARASGARAMLVNVFADNAIGRALY